MARTERDEDASLVELAMRATAGSARSRYDAARATLGMMTGEWDARTRAGGEEDDDGARAKTRDDARERGATGGREKEREW